MKQKGNKTKVVALVLTGAALAGACGAAIGGVLADDSAEVNTLSALVAEKEAILAENENKTSVLVTEAYNEGVNSVEPIVINGTVTETVEIEVDNGNLDLVLNDIYDNEGNVSYLTEYLEDDELDQIVDRIVFANEVKILAIAEADKEIKDLLDKEMYTFSSGNITFDEDDIERVRVQDDEDEITIVNPDYDDKDADVRVLVNFEQDDVKYQALVEVEIKDNEVEDIELVDVTTR